MRTSVGRNDARLMDVFREQQHLIPRLDNLIITMQSRAIDSVDARDTESDATIAGRDLFWPGRIASASSSAPVGGAPALSSLRIRRHPSIGRISDKGSSVIDYQLNHPLCAISRASTFVLLYIPEGRHEELIRSGGIAGAVLKDFLRPAVQFGYFLVSQGLAPREFLRPFKRRSVVVEPNPLQVGMAVLCARNRLCRARLGRIRGLSSNRQREERSSQR